MKKIFILFTIMVLFVSISYAEVYVVYDSASEEIKSVSNEDDAVVEVGWEKAVLPGDISDYPLIYQTQYYKFKKNTKKFIVNTKKISDEETAKEKKKDKGDELLSIQNRLLKDACDMMELEGVAFKEIKCSDF